MTSLVRFKSPGKATKGDRKFLRHPLVSSFQPSIRTHHQNLLGLEGSAGGAAWSASCLSPSLTLTVADFALWLEVCLKASPWNFKTRLTLMGLVTADDGRPGCVGIPYMPGGLAGAERSTKVFQDPHTTCEKGCLAPPPTSPL